MITFEQYSIIFIITMFIIGCAFGHMIGNGLKGLDFFGRKIG